MLNLVIEARKASLAPGMDVRRILPFRLKRMVGPFIFMDHAGPVDVVPSKAKIWMCCRIRTSGCQQ